MSLLSVEHYPYFSHGKHIDTAQRSRICTDLNNKIISGDGCSGFHHYLHFLHNFFHKMKPREYIKFLKTHEIIRLLIKYQINNLLVNN